MGGRLSGSVLWGPTAHPDLSNSRSLHYLILVNSWQHATSLLKGSEDHGLCAIFIQVPIQIPIDLFAHLTEDTTLKPGHINCRTEGTGKAT